MSAIGYLLAKQKPSPAVLFNKTTGFEGDSVGMRHLWNVLGPSVRRIAITLEEHPDTPTVELIRRTKDKLKRRTLPREVTRKDAQFFENTWTGDQIDLDEAADPQALAARRRPLRAAPPIASSPRIPRPAISTSAPTG